MKPINYHDYGFVKVSAASPALSIANPVENAKRTLELFKQESTKGSLIVVFPELGLTGYTCEDLFHTQDLLNETNKGLELLIKGTKRWPGIMVVGLPFQSYDGKLYNCGAVISQGRLLALIPKVFRPNYGEFYEKRYFASGYNVDQVESVLGQDVTLSPNQLVTYNKQIILGCEICEDAWAVITPATNLVLNGANIIVNLSASNELVGKSTYRKELVTGHSARFNSAYVYAAAGSLESTKDVVFGGHCLIAENGSLLKESDRFSFESNAISADIDLNKLAMERRKNSTYGSAKPLMSVKRVAIEGDYNLPDLERTYSPTPFVPVSNHTLVERSEEILQIQATGLARRLLAVNKPKLILGLSGGSDSTLALLVCLEAIKKTKQPLRDIVCISMPGFGTSNRTKQQAQTLASCAGVSFSEIDITQTVLSHFKDIGHDPNQTDFVYENAQARERTQILFDKANQLKGIVIGTGDLSELCLGWATFNGDHMANYGVNASIPKTLIQHLIRYYKDHKTTNKDFQLVLQNVLDTKISPELLPLDKQGDIAQSTEDLVGPYLLHDFFIFHYLRNGFSQEKIQVLANRTFRTGYSPEIIEKWLKVFFTRFKNNQFKRTTLPPGPKVGSVSVSPRGDLRIPDESN
jgi:NAD+ synthase (glutamine-hydrolysing)